MSDRRTVSNRRSGAVTAPLFYVTSGQLGPKLQLYCAVNLVAPHIPAGRGLPGEKLYAGQVAYQPHDTVAGFVRLFAVLLPRRNNELRYVGRSAPWFSLCRKQADLRICPRPVSHTEKPTGGFRILFGPAKCHRFVLKAPCLDNIKGFRQDRECHPQKQHAIRCGQFIDRQGTDFLCSHQGIMSACAAVPAMMIIPRRVGINDIEFSIRYVSLLSMLRAAVGHKGRLPGLHPI